MPGPVGILDQLTPEQQSQLIGWLELYPAKIVAEKVAAPPPDGFGIQTHLTSLRRFYARKQRAAAIEILELARAQAAESNTAHEFGAASARMLAEKAFEFINAPEFRPKHFASIAKWLARLRDQELKSQQLLLAQQRLALERQRSHFNAAVKESQSRTEYQEEKIKDARDRFLRGETEVPRPNGSALTRNKSGDCSA